MLLAESDSSLFRILGLQTVIEYGTGDEVTKAKDKLRQVQGREESISKKRGRSEDIVHAKQARFTA